MIRLFCGELAIDAIQRVPHSGIWTRRSHRPAPHGTAQSLLAHETFERATSNLNAFAVELQPDLVGAIDTKIGLPDALYFANQHLALPGPCTAQFRILLASGMVPISERGNLQNLADRLAPEMHPVLVDKGLHDLKRRSSSAWVKNALANRRTSLAFFSSRLSRSSCLIRSASAVVIPSRCPVSRSYCPPQLHSACALQPIFGAIDSMAAHCDPCPPRDSNTKRTARSRISGGNFVDFFIMAPSSQRREPPQNPGRFS